MKTIFNNHQIQVRDYGRAFELVSPKGTNHVCQGRNRAFSIQSLLRKAKLFYGQRIMFEISEAIN